MEDKGYILDVIQRMQVAEGVTVVVQVHVVEVTEVLVAVVTVVLLLTVRIMVMVVQVHLVKVAVAEEVQEILGQMGQVVMVVVVLLLLDTRHPNSAKYIASILDRFIVSIASTGVSTIHSPARLKDVLNKIGTPVFSWKHLIS